MRTLKMREALPQRRRSWTQRVSIGGQTVYLTVGEYEDGRPGEIFVDVSKQGTFLRGIMQTLARTVSIALQCGATVDMIVYSLKGGMYPPDGQVDGSPFVKEATSVTDWIASELEVRYLVSRDRAEQESREVLTVTIGEGDPLPKKVAGYVPEPWRIGV